MHLQVHAEKAKAEVLSDKERVAGVRFWSSEATFGNCCELQPWLLLHRPEGWADQLYRKIK